MTKAERLTTMTFRCTQELRDKVIAAARRTYRTPSQVVRMLLEIADAHGALEGGRDANAK